MSKTVTLIAAMLISLHATAATAVPRQPAPTREVQDYVVSKLHGNDIVFLGTTHRQPPILTLVAQLLPRLAPAGVTHLALEIGSDQQARLDRYLADGNGLNDILLAPAIDCIQYRRLLTALRRVPATTRPRIIAVDLPAGRYGGPISRDLWMATTLDHILRRPGQVKILAVLGSLHVLRKLDWQRPIGQDQESIRTYLKRQRPHLTMFSIVNVVSRTENGCDFSRFLGPLPGIVAVDLDRRFKGWILGMTRLIAIRPAQPYELVDGVIVY